MAGAKEEEGTLDERHESQMKRVANAMEENKRKLAERGQAIRRLGRHC